MQIIETKTFKDLTTFHIGGNIKYFIEVSNNKEIGEAVSFAKKNNLKIFILGGGSDFLAGDGEFDGLVIKFVGKNITHPGDGVLKAEAGAWWDDVVEFAVENNLQGIECMSGIPGTVGASPIQNIGAYGQELDDVFESLNAFDIEKEQFVSFNKEDCKFGYRESIFKEKSHWQRYLITDITLKLEENGKPKAEYESLKGNIPDNPSLKDIRDAVLRVRNSKLEDPKILGNAGSFFKNPIIGSGEKERLEKDYPEIKIFPFEDKFKVSAAWLIEKAGWKGKIHKGAGVSSKHALVLVNADGRATASHVLELSDLIIKDIKEKFGVELEREVQLINI